MNVKTVNKVNKVQAKGLSGIRRSQIAKHAPWRRAIGAAVSEYINVVMGIAIASILGIATYSGITQEHGSKIAQEMAGKKGEFQPGNTSGGYLGGGGAYSGGGGGNSGASGSGANSSSSSNNSGTSSGSGSNSGSGTGNNSGNSSGANSGHNSGVGATGSHSGGSTSGGISTGTGTSGGNAGSGANTGPTDPSGNNLTDPTTDPTTENPEPEPQPEPPSLLSADGLVDFGEGLWTGLKTQGEGLWHMITHPIETAKGFYTLGKALIQDPVAAWEVIKEEFKNDIDAVLSGDPKELGRIIGENVSPAAIARLAGKLSGIAKRFDDDNPSINCGKRSSFAGDTLVWTENGLRPISGIIVGDKVLARNDESYQDSYQEVTELYGRDVAHYYEVQFDKLTIKATEEHPFWQQAKGWVEAKDLVVGEVVATQSSDLTIRRVELINKPLKVHNFAVANDHTYFVGNYGMWVHNQNKPCDIDRDIDVIGKVSNIAGKAYKGKVYRYNSKDYPDTVWELNPGNANAPHRYSRPGKGAVYTATDEKTARLEVGDVSKHDLHTKDVEYDNMLDLSDPAVRKELGITDTMITDRNGPEKYKLTQDIGDKARELGFDGVIAPSAANSGGINVIVFESIP